MAKKVGTIFHGKVRLFETMVAFPWRGLQVFRSLAPDIRQTKSLFRERINAQLTFLARFWQDQLTPEQRSLWRSYAGQLTSQAREISNQTAEGTYNIIPPRRRIYSGFNAFISTNMIAFTRNVEATFYLPPLSLPLPPSPKIVLVSQSGGVRIKLQNRTNLLNAGYQTIVMAVFAQIQRIKRIHTQVVKLQQTTADDTSEIETIITQIRIPKTDSMEIVPIETYNGGEIRLQADLAAFPSEGSIGPTLSAPSELLAFKLNVQP
jgi:hypothetical protein